MNLNTKVQTSINGLIKWTRFPKDEVEIVDQQENMLNMLSQQKMQIKTTLIFYLIPIVSFPSGHL